MKVSKKYLHARVSQLAKATGRELKLDSWSDGSRRRYQIQHITNPTTGAVTECYPHHGHWYSQDFDAYLDGMLDCLKLVEGGAK